MGRLVVLIVLVVLAVWLLRRALGHAKKKHLSGEDIVKRMDAELVRCARCGVHLPRSEARQNEGMLFCSDEHARLGRG